MNVDLATMRLLRVILIGGGIILAMSVAAEVFKPVALAVLLTFLLAPIVGRLERLGLPRVLSVAAVLMVATVMIAGAGYVVGNQFVSLAQDVPQYVDNIKAKIERLQPSQESTVDKVLDAVRNLSEPARTEVASEDPRDHPQLVRVVQETDVWEQIHTYMGPFEAILAMGGIVLLLVVFLLLERDDISDKIIQLVGWGQIGVTTKTLWQIGQTLSSYLTALALVNAGFGVVIGLGCWAIGLPSPALWGFLAAVCRFIPYLGTVLSFSFPFLISIAAFPGWTQPVLVLALFAGAEVVVNSVEPMLYGKSTGISPIGLLISALFWAWLWGPLGLLLANALTVCLAVAGRYIPGMSALGTLLRHEVSVSDDLRWYQRVLSHDLDNSLTLLDDALKTRSFEEVCNEIVIPTLSRAEHDRTHDHIESRDVAFIWRVVREWLDDLAVRDDVTLFPAGAETASKNSATTAPEIHEPLSLVGVATGGGADSLILRMLNILIQPSGQRLTILSAGGSSLKITDKLAELNPALIVVSHLPPVGLTRARYLTKRMRARYPNVPLTFAYWDRNAETTDVVTSLKPAAASRVVVSLAAARQAILEQAAQVAASPVESESETEAHPLARSGRS